MTKIATKITFCNFAYKYCESYGPSTSIELKDAFITRNPYRVWRNIGTNNSISNWLNADSRFSKVGKESIFDGRGTAKYVKWGIV